MTEGGRPWIHGLYETQPWPHARLWWFWVGWGWVHSGSLGLQVHLILLSSGKCVQEGLWWCRGDWPSQLYAGGGLGSWGLRHRGLSAMIPRSQLRKQAQESGGPAWLG